jgi:hypothetical protein
MGSQFVYELLIDANANPQAAHIALIDVETLRRKMHLRSEPRGVMSNLAGGDGDGPQGSK